ncbi:neuraminidase-like domain-containing protein [Nodosilinea sp. P-1105]|uniref:Tc toxin subunit A-related protein n=1 Tax=Nodosilinea sp. P-1105 TaxID=2546229 RepID=UPI00146B9911|nr:neuraminidase-like domain-containing protein [Nodosilinea sp. P-1105]NMF85685.1 hypothetical protein [Nodosilinea sp. P-1105]
MDDFPSAFGDTPPNPTVLAEIQAVLENQHNRQGTITETLERYRQEHRNAILAGLSDLLGVDPAPLQAVIAYFQSVNEPLSDPARLLERLIQLADLDEDQPIPADLLDYLFRLHKILLLVTRFELTTAEIRTLLTHPACFSVSDVFRPNLTDLTHLFTFTELKASFGGESDQLLELLRLKPDSSLVNEAILQLSGWDLPQLLRLQRHFGQRPYNRVENLILLQRGFALAERLRVDIGFLIQLAATDDLSLGFYRQQADALLPVLRGLYDDEQWPRVYRPLRDPLATQKRDALLALAMDNIPADFEGRRSPDLLSEYLLLDVQVSSAVETSHIVQGTAALQQYVQRCLMNLEKGVDPATIPTDQWEWMQNYRVWEANRKVFLYPESFIEPELRRDKTPLFEELEQELMQNDINVNTAQQAFNNYLNQLATLADLKIVGAYRHRDVEQLFIPPRSVDLIDHPSESRLSDEVNNAFRAQGIMLSNQARLLGSSPLWRIVDGDTQVYTLRLSHTGEVVVSQAGDSTLYLVGRSTNEPHTYYYREWINETQWRPWQSIDLTINADFVTPVFVFNRLFLFWVEFTEESRSVGGEAATTIYRPTIRYSFPDFNGTWTQPQTYAAVNRELSVEERSRSQWQRVYALRTTFEVAQLSRGLATERERLLIIYGQNTYGQNTDGADDSADAPLTVRTLRNARERELLQLQFQSRQAEVDLGLAPTALGEQEWLIGHIPIASNLEILNDIARDNPDANRERLRRTLNAVLDRLPREPRNNSTIADTNYQVIPQGDQQWFILFENFRWLARQEEVRVNNRLNSQINIYELSNRFLQSIVNLSAPHLTVDRYMGHMGDNSTNTSTLDALADGSADRELRASFRDILNELFDRPEVQPLTIVNSNSFSIERLESQEGQWRLTLGEQNILIGRESIGNQARLNVYRLNNRPTAANWRYVGFMTSQAPLDAALTGDSEALADLHAVLERLYDRDSNDRIRRIRSLRLPRTYHFRHSQLVRSRPQWLATFINQQVLIEREGPERFNVYLLDASFSGIEFGLENQGLNRWLFTDPNQGSQLLIAPQPQRDRINIYRFTSAILHLRDEAEPNQYLSALAPVGLTAPEDNDTSPVLWRDIPLSATLLDVNNQNGWYVLDTGEDQFLIRANLPALATDAERLVFPPGGSSNLFTFHNDPLLQRSSPFTFERIDTSAARELSVILFRDGIDGLLSLQSQQLSEGDFSSYLPTSNRQQLELPTTTTIDFDGAYGLYYREIFFHIPFFIANQLNANQNFADAQRWYHYIFNPTSSEAGGDGQSNGDRYWQYRPFRDPNLMSLRAILSNQQALAEYRENPFDPHAIARLRIVAYEKAIVMKYIDNLLDWADHLFAQDNRESINQAFLLYVLAFNLLGPRPEARAARQFEEIGDYQGIQDAFEQTPEFLTDLDLNGNVAARTSTITLNQNGNIITTFCIPENADFIGFWDRVEDRLFKIRHSLDIEGVFRQLALFQPPLDVRALVQAFAAGGRDIGSLLADVNLPVPHYRYGFMLNQAKEMIGTVRDFGGALLDALEKRDAEQLTMLQTTHEQNLLELTTRSLELERDEARGALAALMISRRKLNNRLEHFTTLIDAPLSGEEVSELLLMHQAQGIKAVWAAAKKIEAIFASVPDFSKGFASLGPVGVATTGGSSFSNKANAIGEISNIAADIAESIASTIGKVGEYRRRLEDWQLERFTTERDLEEVNQHIQMAELTIQRTEQALTIHRRTIEQNREIATFHRRKFGNEALYNWMVSRLASLYFQAYKLAYDFAKSAERALQYELPTNQQFIHFGHWDSLRRGLLAGEALLLDVNRMEKFHLDNDSRFLEIEKTIPLSQVDNEALAQLLATGECEFRLGEALFNHDYPGHYFRVIRTIGLTLKFRDGANLGQDPYLTVNASLTQVGNKTLLEPDIDAVRYLMGLDGAAQPSSSTLRVNWRANQQVAISKPQLDNGLFGGFNLNFALEDRYLPFEGTGAISHWQLEVPHDTNPGLVEQVEDVIIHLRYTANSDRGQFKAQVQAAMTELDQ